MALLGRIVATRDAAVVARTDRRDTDGCISLLELELEGGDDAGET